MDQSNNQNSSAPQPASGIGDPNTAVTNPVMPQAPAVNTPPMPDPGAVPQPAQPMPTVPVGQAPIPMDSGTPPPVDPSMQPTPTMGPQPVQEMKSGGSGKKIILLILGIIFLIGAGAAVYFFVIKKQPAEPMTVETTPSPTPVPEENLIEKEVGETPEEQEVIDIEEVSIDEEFQAIDEDLQQL